MQSSNAEQTSRRGGNRPRVAILGGGFGGLYAAKALAYAPVDVTIVDQTNHHLFQPMLYQVATGQLSGDEIAAPIRNVVCEQKNTDVLLEKVADVDVDGRCVITQDGDRIPYDYLIVATGSEYNYFGHDQWKPLAPSLKTLSDASEIRERVLDAFERAEKEPDPDKIKSLLTFVLVGAGPTGVEMAGAIAELARTTLKGNFRHFDPASAKIIIVEAASRILSGFDDTLAAKAGEKLAQMGVEIRLNTPVDHVDEHSVTAKGQKIPAETVIWTAGTKASPAARWLKAPADKNGRVIVEPDLTIPGHPEIFVIGDTARVTSPRVNIFGFPIHEGDGKPEPLPAVAQPAMQEGQYAAKVIRRRVRGLAAPPPFVYRDKGNLATVGRSFAIADLGKLRVWGFLGWAIWLGVHIWYLIGFANRLLVIVQWAVAYFTNQRTGRIITTEFEERHPDTSLSQRVGPPLKSAPEHQPV